jgi:AraC-like DNA-binding protein
MATKLHIDQAIIELFEQGLTNGAIASQLGCSLSRVKTTLSRKGLKRDPEKVKQEKIERARITTAAIHEKSAERDSLIVQLYQQGMVVPQIIETVGISEMTVYKVLKRKGVELNRFRPKLVWDRQFFDRDEPITAYWAGFIYADGCICRDKEKKTYALAMKIHTRDLEHIQTFCNHIGLSHSSISFQSKRPACGITIRDTGLKDSLERWGIVHRKSYNWVEPNIPDDDLFRAFVVGLIDGDGHIRFKNARGHASISIATNHQKLYDWLVLRLRQMGYTGHANSYAHGLTCKEITFAGVKSVDQLINLLRPWEFPNLKRKWKDFSSI